MWAETAIHVRSGVPPQDIIFHGWMFCVFLLHRRISNGNVGQLAFAQLELDLYFYPWEYFLRQRTAPKGSISLQKLDLQVRGTQQKPVISSLSLCRFCDATIHLLVAEFSLRFGFVFVKTLSTFIQNEKKNAEDWPNVVTIWIRDCIL